MKPQVIETYIKVNEDDFQGAIEKANADLALKSLLNRYYNVLIGTKEVAHIHSVNPATVLNYIADGLIEPEMKLGENDHHQFRLSYVLMLDFKVLQKQLRAKNKGWDK